jgi:hypothetical protein
MPSDQLTRNAPELFFVVIENVYSAVWMRRIHPLGDLLKASLQAKLIRIMRQPPFPLGSSFAVSLTPDGGTNNEETRFDKNLTQPIASPFPLLDCQRAKIVAALIEITVMPLVNAEIVKKGDPQVV